MAKYRHVYTSFWEDRKVMEKFTPEDKYFYLYLLTNPHTTQIGIYRMSKKLISFEIGYSIESVDSLLNRFITHHKLVKYNDETGEIAIKNWGKYNLINSGKPVLDLLRNEIKEIEDITLLNYIGEAVSNEVIKNFIQNFALNKTRNNSDEEEKVAGENNVPYHVTYNDTYHHTSTSGGQNENEKENENENNIYTHKEDNQHVPVDNVSNVDNKSNFNKNAVNSKIVPYEEIIAEFNTMCRSLTKVMEITEQRKVFIRAFWIRMKYDMTSVKAYFQKIEKSDFLSGRCRSGGWSCNFDWILSPDNFVKVFEGTYDNKIKQEEHSFNNYQQREYDYDELEKKLLGWT